MRVAVIDDGINSKKFNIGTLYANVEVKSDLTVCKVEKEPEAVTHGTVCAGIIRKYAPSAQLISIKALSSVSHVGRVAQLVKALEWCASQDIRLINISIGSGEMQDFVPLQKAVSRLLQQGKTLVAANTNGPGVSWPAYANGVIGVCANEKDIVGYRVLKNNMYGLQICAQSIHTLAQEGGSWRTRHSNSYAAPYITALSHNYLCNNATHGPLQVLHVLSAAEGAKGAFFTGVLPDYLDNAIVVKTGEDSIYPQHFCFPVQTVLTPAQFEEYQPEELSCLLAIGRNSLQYLNALKRQRQFYGAAYAGIMPAQTKKSLQQQGCYIWDEQDIPLLGSIRDQKNDGLTGPVYLVGGSADEAVALAQRLSTYMLANGYKNLVVSDISMCYLYGFYSLPTIRREEYIGRLFRLFGLSCVLYCADTAEYLPNMAFDASISADTDGEVKMEIEGETVELEPYCPQASLKIIVEAFENVV